MNHMILDGADIRKEMSLQFAVDEFKKRTIMNSEKDVHVAFGIYGRNKVINKILDESLFFHLSDRAISLEQCKLDISANSEIAYSCMFGDCSIEASLREHVETLIDSLIADYEVIL